MFKKLLYILLGASMMVGTVALAAPTAQNFTNIQPFITDTYDNGTSTLEWFHVYTKTLCLSGDCRSVWPSSGSTFSYLFPGNATTTNITFSGGLTGTLTGNADTATKLQTARTIGTITGDATSAGSSFDGSGNNTNALTLATVNSNVGSFTNANITVNAKGLITAASNGTGGSGFSYPFPLTNNATSTLTQFNGGLTAFASSTIGNGSGTGGLTINGNATTTGQFIGAVGSAAAPTFTFAGNANTGFYRSAANSIGIAVSGVLSGTFTSTGDLTMAAGGQVQGTNTRTYLLTGQTGTAAAPTYSFVGDTNTGIYDVAADTLAFTTNGIEGARFTSTGLFGVGTTTPWGQLSASSTSAFPTLAIHQHGVGAAAIFLGGNVGFNLTAPTRSTVEIQATTTDSNSHPFTIWNSAGTNIFETDGSGTTTSSNGFNITNGCFAVNGTCLSSGGGGTVTSVTGTYPVISSGGNTPAISLAFGTTTSNIWAGTQTFTNSPVFSTLGVGTVNSTAGGTIYNTATTSLSVGSPLTVTGTFGSLIGGTNSTINCQTASGSQAGCLSSADWTTFNGKQAAGNYITALTGDGTATGPGSVAFTLATVNSNIGTFNNVTVNGKGLVTAASNVSYATFGYPFPNIVGGGNATSSLVGFTGGYLDTASSTHTALTNFPGGIWNAAGSVGIGSTTPGSLFSIGSQGTGTNFFDNATTSKSGVGGYNIAQGCYAVAGVCLSSGSSLIGTAGQVAFFNSIPTAIGTSSLIISPTTGNVGVASTTPGSLLSVGWGGPQLVLASSSTYSANATYNTPTGASKLVVQAWGGGGGGAGSDSGLTSSGGGGGAGAFVKSNIFGPSSSYAITIGTGGGGGAAASGAGGAAGTGFKSGAAGGAGSGGGGGSTSFGGSIIACGGGGGGNGSASQTPAGAGGTSGGNGGGGTGGAGGGGGCNTAGSTSTGGTGGTTPTGTSGAGGISNGTGNQAGAGGGSSAGVAGNGNAGANNSGGAGGVGGTGSGGATASSAGTADDSGGGGTGGGTFSGNGGNGGKPGAGAGGSGDGNGSAIGGTGGNGQITIYAYAYATSTLPFTIGSAGNINFQIQSNGGLYIGTSTALIPGVFHEISAVSGSTAQAIIQQINGVQYITEQIDSVGHYVTGGPAPTCGTGCAAIVGDDRTMKVTTSAVVSVITVNFANTYTTTPICIVTNEGSTVAVGASTTPSTVVVTALTAVSSIRLGIICQNSANFSN